FAACRQGRARPVRNAHPQARARHCRSERQDRSCTDEARPRGGRRRTDQVALIGSRESRVGNRDSQEPRRAAPRPIPIHHSPLPNKRDTTMSIGLIGRKCGMSRIFTEDGRSVPVTLIEATPNRITQVKTVETDGYCAVQVTAGTKRAALINKPLAGHYAKAKVEAGRGLWEFRIEPDQVEKFSVGGELKADEVFQSGQIVDVAGVS